MKKYMAYGSTLILGSFLLKALSFQGDSLKFMDGLKAFLAPFVGAYLLAFQNPNTSLLLFLIITIACAGSLYWMYLLKYDPLRKKLNLSIEKAEMVQFAIISGKVSPKKALIDIENDDILQPVVS